MSTITTAKHDEDASDRRVIGLPISRIVVFAAKRLTVPLDP